MNKIQQILAIREGGHVLRNHTMPHNGHYDVAQHSFNALSLLFLLHDHCDPSLNLIKAVLWHDVPERWTGDVPAPAKWASPELKMALDKLEFRILTRIGIQEPFTLLTPEEENWLKGVDLLELWIWAIYQARMEVPGMEDMCHRIEDLLDNAKDIPLPIYNFIDNFSFSIPKEIL